MATNELLPIRIESEKNLSELVEDALIDFILSNRLESGDQLPSHSSLTKSLRVSSVTLRNSLARLEERGIIRIEHGKGTFINAVPDKILTRIDVNLSTTKMIRDQGKVPSITDLSVVENKLPSCFWGCFSEEDKNQLFLSIQRTRAADSKPFAISISYLNHKLNEHKPLLSEYYGSLYEFINNQTDTKIATTDALIYSEKANKFIADKLKINLSSSILVLQQIHFNSEGEPMIASLEYFYRSFITLKVTIIN